MSSDAFDGVYMRVERILEEIPATRNYDLLLILHVWRRYDGMRVDFSDRGLILTLPPGYLEKLTNFETIRRCRQHIQASGRFLPTDPEVRRQRRLREDEFREYFKKEDGEEQGVVV